MVISYPKVNLIEYRVDLKKISGNRQKLATKISIASLVVFLVVFIPTILVRFSVMTKKKNLISFVSDLTQEIQGMSSIEAKYTLLNSKSTALIALDDEKVVIQPKILEVYEIMPNGTLIDDVSFGADGDFLNVSVRAINVFAVGDLLNSVSNSVGNKFSAVRVDSTKRADDGTYKVSMEIYFVQAKHNNST